MRILLVTKQLLEKRDGKVYCEFALSSTIRRFEMMGELFVCCYNYEGKSCQPVDCLTDLADDHVAFLDNESNLKTRYLKRGRNRDLIEQFVAKVDLVIGYIPATVGDLALTIAHRHHKKYMSFLVACIWDGMWHHRNWKARAMAPIFFYETKRTVLHSDYVWYVTEQFLQRRYPTRGKSLGCTDTNIDPLSDATLQARRQRIETQGKKVRLLTVGHLDVGFKGQQFVIQAMPALLEKGLDVEYYMIGEGEGTHLRQLARHCGVAERAFFLGRKSRQEVLQWMDDTDIYIQPSLQEGLPRAVAEAMSRAMPVVVSNTGGMPEMVEPEFITRRKSVEDIVRVVASFDQEKMLGQARRNFEKAADYQPFVVDEKLKAFFALIEREL
ncbi:MAG: glycosyltransferase family 4 protein [Prevotella sp.]|nr:glycosyltransferase family 4 protein [Prevotella sp.]